MDDKGTGFLDCTEEFEDTGNEIQERVIKNITEVCKTGGQRGYFEQSVSIESYCKRGFIKDGELVKDPAELFDLST